MVDDFSGNYGASRFPEPAQGGTRGWDHWMLSVGNLPKRIIPVISTLITSQFRILSRQADILCFMSAMMRFVLQHFVRRGALVLKTRLIENETFHLGDDNLWMEMIMTFDGDDNLDFGDDNWR